MSGGTNAKSKTAAAEKRLRAFLGADHIDLGEQNEADLVAVLDYLEKIHAPKKARNGKSVSQKGYRFENDLRLDLVASGFQRPRRVPLSGAGEEKNDITFLTGWGDTERIEAKCRGCLPSYLTSSLSNGATAVAFKEDRGKTFVLITWDRYKELCQ